jgi:hypothetical protein
MGKPMKMLLLMLLMASIQWAASAPARRSED